MTKILDLGGDGLVIISNRGCVGEMSKSLVFDLMEVRAIKHGSVLKKIMRLDARGKLVAGCDIPALLGLPSNRRTLPLVE